MSKFKHRKDCPVYGDYPKDDVPCGCKVMSEELNIKDFPYHTNAAIIEVANTAIAKAYEAGQRHLPESVEAVLVAAREYELAIVALKDNVDMITKDGLLKEWDDLFKAGHKLIDSIRNHDKMRKNYV